MVLPTRCLYSFCRLSSLTVVPSKTHVVVAGTEIGSLVVYDLRAQAHKPEGSSEVEAASVPTEKKPAFLTLKSRIPSHHGRIRKSKGGKCVGSFPGKYGTGWNGVTAERHGMSVGCVFLNSQGDGMGQHVENPQHPGRCYCSTIYGERDYESFGYLIEIKPTDGPDDVQRRRDEAVATNAFVWDPYRSGTTKEDAIQEAKERWLKAGKVASWGCKWFAQWCTNIKEAVENEQQLVVYYFEGEVGQGKLAWANLCKPDANLWDGGGLGGSQKCEVAYLDMMRQTDSRYNYVEEDVGEFIRNFGTGIQESAAKKAVVGSARTDDPAIAHFHGPVWLGSVYSTDVFAFSAERSQGMLEMEDGEEGRSAGKRGVSSSSTQADLGDALHCVEICCVRCSDPTAGDVLIFALDLMGVVSFWRIMELASGSQQNIKLALQGSINVSSGSRVIGDFLDASFLAIHPQQQAQFVVVSAAGLRQAQRKRTASIADGPRTLELVHQGLLDFEGENGDAVASAAPWPCSDEPCSIAFNPFFPGLLLAAYAEGDLAIFDCTLCVPLTHWGAALPKAPRASASVAWSPCRPCVFFAKSADTLDVWDLAERSHGPVMSVDLRTAGANPTVGGSEPASCAELQVGADGRLVVAYQGVALVLGLPKSLTTPLRTVPPQHSKAEQPIEDLLVRGHEKAQTFPTLARHCRTVEVPQHCQLERDLLRCILAGIHPMQAWV